MGGEVPAGVDRRLFEAHMAARRGGRAPGAGVVPGEGGGPVRGLGGEAEAWARENLSEFAVEAELWWRWMRWASLWAPGSLWFLSWWVLGYRDLDPSFHWKMCRRWERWPMRDDLTWYPMQADACPRGGFKTTLATVGRGIQTALRCPEECILIGHGESEKAEAIHKHIKTHLESNEWLRWLFPDVIPEKPGSAGPWTAESTTLIRMGTHEEGTFNVTSAERDTTGGHYTLIILDDWVTEKNVGTAASIERVYQKFQMATSDVLSSERNFGPDDKRWRDRYRQHQFYDEESGELRIPHRHALVFTRWDVSDANSRAIDPKGPYRGLIDVNVEQAWRPDPDHPEGGTSFFPGKYPKRRLMEIRQKMGDYRFSAQFQQDPHPVDAQAFPKKRFNWYTEDMIEGLTLTTWSGWDTSTAASEESDHSVIMTVSLDAAGNVYLRRVDRGQFVEKEQIRRAIMHLEMFEPRLFTSERSGIGLLMLRQLREQARALGVAVPLHEIKRGGQGAESKNQRILSLTPYHDDFKFHLPRGAPWVEDFLDECKRWLPSRKSQQDDQLDTLADIMTVAKRPALERGEYVRDRGGRFHSRSLVVKGEVEAEVVPATSAVAALGGMLGGGGGGPVWGRDGRWRR